MVGQLSKKAGSTVAARNRNGSYFRTRVMGTNPNTTLQIDARASLAGFAQGWKSLTQTQRNGWAALGLLMVRLDSLGQSYSLTGLQAYESINKTLDVLGSAAVTDAPTFASPAAITSATITATSV